MVLDCLAVHGPCYRVCHFSAVSFCHGESGHPSKTYILTCSPSSQTRVVVQAQGILTQLLFDHALRIRVKADAQSNAPAFVASNTVSLAEESSDENTVLGNADGEQREASSPSLASTTTKVEEEKTSLVGKLNTLATADMESLMNGRDFLFVSE